jgi:predicted nucleic acid-binding Zn ribbon protein
MRDNDQSLAEALDEWVKHYRFRDKLLQGKVIASWENTVGHIIAKETENLYISRRVLFVKLRSEALKHELEYAKRKLVNSLNKHAGGEVIKEVKFI